MLIIDASITPTNNKPKGKKMLELIDEAPPTVKEYHKNGVYKGGSWTKKGGKFHYGYKKHYACNSETSLVLSVCTSTAKDHDSKYMKDCIEKTNIPPDSRVYADKGYFGKPNSEVLESEKFKNGILNKAVRGKKLSFWERKRNKILSKKRYKVERILGGIKRWFKSGFCRYVGLTKTHGQHVLEAICYNIKIRPKILISKL